MASGANTGERACTMRCSVEKRTMCRDLQKWSKTLLCMIGLENVAGRMVARKKLAHGQCPQALRVSPFVDPVLLGQMDAPKSNAEERTPLPQDWDPKERCAICIQIAEKEELTKKATSSSAVHSQQSRTKKEVRAAADRTKEDSKTAARNVDGSVGTPTGSSHLAMGSIQQSLLSPAKQQQGQSHSQQLIDWRSVSAGAGNSGHPGVFGSMNMFHAGSTAGQSTSSSAYNSASSLTASMFAGAGYHSFFDLNQLYYWNELFSQCNKAAVASAASSSAYSMMPPLIGVPGMAQPALSTPFSFPNLVASLGGQPAGPNIALDEPLDLTKKSKCGKHSSSGQFPASTSSESAPKANNSSASSSAGNVGASQSPLNMTSGCRGPGSNASPNCSSWSGNKRTYTQAALQAAVDEIRSKKLGTRKASVMYGIPRSTLRNKISKLEIPDDDTTQMSPSSTGAGPGSCPSPGSGGRSRRKDGSKKLEDAFGTAEEEKSTDGSQQRGADAVCGRTTTSSEDSSASVSSSSSSLSCQNESSTFNYGEGYIGNWTTSAALTAQLARRQAVEALFRVDSNGNAASITHKDAASFPFSMVNGSAAVKSVVQDAICCALNDNLKMKTSSEVNMESSSSPLSLVSPKQPSGSKRSSSRRRGANSKSLSVTMVKIERPDQSASAGGASSQTDEAGDAGKKIRPKRGQYRKYDKNALAEAVHAVRRGEMSVHRAGSFYGVPHSTLEYKVKERNLLRPKKRDLKKKLEEANAEANAQAAATSASSRSPVEAAKATPPATNDQSKSKAEPSRHSKAKRPKKATSPALQTGPSSDTHSLLPAAASTSLDLSIAAAADPNLGKKPVALVGSPSSSPASSSCGPSNQSCDASKGIEDPAGKKQCQEAEEPCQEAEENKSETDGDFSTLKAYEAGYKAALLSASDIFQRFQMQNYASANGGSASEIDTENTPSVSQTGDPTAKK